MTRTKSVFLIVLLITFSCDWIFKPGPCDASGPAIVYKTKSDYTNNLTIQLSKDGKTVTAYPGKEDAIKQKPLLLENGYLFKRMAGDVVLSLTLNDYANSSKNYSNEEFINLIIDRDPYLEKYECCDCTKGDTAAINNLIRNNLLINCENLK